MPPHAATSSRPWVATYEGSLGDEHVRAVVRTALRAHGFSPRTEDVRREVEAQSSVGRRLRDHAIPEAMRGDAASEAYRRLAVVDPHLWERLPFVAGFGYRQGAVLARLARQSSALDEDVAFVDAVFNVGIALFDHLVDDHEAGDTIFGLVDDSLVSALFDADAASLRTMVEGRRAGVADPRLEVLLGLISVFATRGRRLTIKSANEAAWRHLGRYVRTAYEAERSVSASSRPGAPLEDWPSALEAKSALPSLVMLQVSMLTAGSPSGEAPRVLRERATALGRVIGAIDDLVDLTKDCRTGTPSPVLLRLSADLACAGRGTACDADIFRAIGDGARDVVKLLAHERFLPDVATWDDRDRDGDLARFAAAAVALWSGWEHDIDIEPPVALWSGWEHDIDIEPPVRNTSTGRIRASPVSRAARLLLERRRAGYDDAVHHFPMPNPAGGGLVTYPSLLFQRATILDALIDAHEAGAVVPRHVLDEEAIAILRGRHPYMRGGWSYIPEMPQLPPDADDLGMVLQVLHRVGGTVLAGVCHEPVRLALDAADPSGAVPTWIFGPRSRCPEDEPAIAYLEAIGRPGDGAQAEVVANLCYALALHDRRRYTGALERALTYLESAQADDGHWNSAWYAGDYYGTYRAVSVLGLLRPESPALLRARSFLLDRQVVDGGWGGAGSDPLSAALAILALPWCGGPPAADAAARGAAYLLGMQDADGGWPAVAWTAFPTPYGLQTYGSRSVSTAFALKALLAVGGTRTSTSREVASHAGEGRESATT